MCCLLQRGNAFLGKRIRRTEGIADHQDILGNTAFHRLFSDDGFVVNETDGLTDPLGYLVRFGEGSVVGDMCTEAETVIAVEIDMHFNGFADRCKRGGKVQRIADRNTVVLGGVPDECGRCHFIDLCIGRKQIAQYLVVDLIAEQIAEGAVVMELGKRLDDRVAEHELVGTVDGDINVIHACLGKVRAECFLVPQNARASAQVTACREARRCDVVRADAEFDGMLTDIAQCGKCLQLGDRETVGRAAVVQNEHGLQPPWQSPFRG